MKSRLPGSLLGALLTVTGWFALEVTSFGARIVVALVGFSIGHGIVYAVRRVMAPPAP
jgi:hypothetical protein